MKNKVKGITLVALVGQKKRQQNIQSKKQQNK